MYLFQAWALRVLHVSICSFESLSSSKEESTVRSLLPLSLGLARNNHEIKSETYSLKLSHPSDTQTHENKCLLCVTEIFAVICYTAIANLHTCFLAYRLLKTGSYLKAETTFIFHLVTQLQLFNKCLLNI